MRKMKREMNLSTSTQSLNVQPPLPIIPQRSALKKSYKSMLDDLTNNQAIKKEIALGKQIGFYKIYEEIGSGEFSKVNLGMHCLINEKVAIKIMNKSVMNENAQNSLANEIKTMEQLYHPNIIRLFEHLETTTRVYLVMEYACGGELHSHVYRFGKLSENVCKPMFAQIVSAISYMHSKNIIHRDIKPKNVILSEGGLIKLADFGFACQVNPNDKLTTFCGSPAYAAPELLRNDEYYGPNVDIWAIGVLLYFMLVGRTPFHAHTINSLKKSILRGIYPVPNHLSISAQHTISQMLVANPKKRSTIDEIKNCNFLKGCKFPEPYIQCSMSPDENELIENPLALQIWNTLRSYGIDDPIIRESELKGIRSAVVGIYRIVLHQAQQQQLDQLECKPNRNDQQHLMLERGKSLPVMHTFCSQSKACSIL